MRNVEGAELGASPSSRRAWIEIFSGKGYITQKGWVALLAEGVDRNSSSAEWSAGILVALLAEGVDRNR